jgi:hypothetical protein
MADKLGSRLIARTIAFRSTCSGTQSFDYCDRRYASSLASTTVVPKQILARKNAKG